MDESYGQSPNSIRAGRPVKRKDFPAMSGIGGDTMIERAMETAATGYKFQPPKENTEEAPKSATVKRTKFAKPTRPTTAAASNDTKGMKDVSPAEERNMTISQALMRGASMQPGGQVGSILRGMLGGASVGMDIGTALDKYRRQKDQETAANAAMKMAGENE